MKKIIALSTMLISLSSFAMIPISGNMICGKIEKNYDTVRLLSNEGAFELTTYNKLVEAMLESFGNGQSCCVSGDLYSDQELIVDKVIPVIGV